MTKINISVALGGGGALGWAHIGALRALSASPFHITAISGTSIGAIVGAFYAAGKLDILEDLARTTNIRTLFRFFDPSFGRGSIVGARNIEKELQTHLGDLQFDDISIPMAIVAGDLRSGEAVYLKKGSLVRAIRASMSLPGIFKPVEQDGQLLVDGGVVDPVPVKAAREMAPQSLCVGINLQNDYVRRTQTFGIDKTNAKPASSFSIVRSYMALSLRNLGIYSLKLDPPDFDMSLKVGAYDMQHFTKAEELIAIGERDALLVIDEMKAKLCD